jgi:6-pyruvoyl-tetrahydropterin synthase
MRPRGRVLTAVKSHFSAAHRCKETGEMHGHTWDVTVWFKNINRVDARVFKQQLESDLARWDHKTLPDELAWGEDIAEDLAKRFLVVAVEVSRPRDGISARWELEE